jgi:hypothetical protein
MDLGKYRVWCTNESTYVETDFLSSEPTKCPNNIAHDIDKSKSICVERIPEVEPRDQSARKRVHQSSRPLGSITYWTGQGDDPSNVKSYGTGESFTVNHQIGDPTTQVKYLDFNCIENETFLHEGYISWSTAKFDTLTLDVVPRTVTTESSTNTIYNLYGGYMIIPAAGNGTINVTSDLSLPTGGLVYMPNDDLGNQPVAFWNAKWDKVNNIFNDITPAPQGNGRYNMFKLEVCMACFVNNIPLLGSGSTVLESSDSSSIGHGMRIRFTAKTNGTDHEWGAANILTMYRVKTT